MKNTFILLLLSMLGFSGCNAGQLEEYGVPHIKFRVKGIVTDPEGAPIRGIAVQERDGETTTTDAGGNYDLSGIGSYYSSIRLVFTDTDGPTNGGEFVEKTVENVFTESDQIEAGSGWYDGAYETTLDVTLQKQQTGAE